MPSHPGHVWYMQDLETGGEACFNDLHMAMHAAEGIVGNRSFAKPDQDILLYGPGDGSTRVMIRKFRRSEAVAMDLDVPMED